MAQMPGGNSALIPCEEGSEEHLFLCQIIEELEGLCGGGSFSCFDIKGYTKQVVAGTMYQVKIRVADEGPNNYVHAKVLQHLPHTGKTEPEIMFFKKDQTEDAPFNFTDMDGVMRALGGAVEVVEENKNGDEEMKDESQPATTDAAA